MTRSTNRRAAAWLTGAALAAGLLLAGCSAGQIAETARKNPSIQGVNADAQLRDGDGRVVGSVAVRDVMVAYDGPEGYKKDGKAPLEVRIFNDTPEAVTVRIIAAEPAEESAEIVKARAVVLEGKSEPAASPTTAEPVASPTRSGSAKESPAAQPPPAGAPATVEIPAGGFVVLNREAGRYLSVTGLSDRLTAGMSVPLTFRFSNGLDLSVTAPVATPLSPAPRGTAEVEEGEGGH